MCICVLFWTFTWWNYLLILTVLRIPLGVLGTRTQIHVPPQLQAFTANHVFIIASIGRQTLGSLGGANAIKWRLHERE